jgi:hypothetical protein
MANLPGPYEIEFQLSGWLTPARQHVMRFNTIAVGNPPAGTAATAIDMQKQGGATAKLNVVANQIWEFLRLAYHTTITCTGYTLWKYVSGTTAKDFISAGAVTNPLGTVGSAPVPAWENVLTFRSANGGIMKVVYLESSTGGDTRSTLIPSAVGTPFQRFAAYLLSADNVAIARDDAFLIAALRQSNGQNERIWRKLYRSS